jgi:hypothetical protein
MVGRGLNSWKNLGSRGKHHLKQWTKPVTTTLVTETLSDMTSSRADLIAENAMLRQQLIVLNRQVKRPQLTNGDRIRLVFLARCTQFWQQALHIIQPDTLLRCHRDLFRINTSRSFPPDSANGMGSQDNIDGEDVVAMTLRSNYHFVLGHNVNGPTEFTVDPFVYTCGSDGGKLAMWNTNRPKRYVWVGFLVLKVVMHQTRLSRQPDWCSIISHPARPCKSECQGQCSL